MPEILPMPRLDVETSQKCLIMKSFVKAEGGDNPSKDGFDKYELKQAVLDPANRQGDLSFLLEFGRDRPKSLASIDMHSQQYTTFIS